MFTKKKIIWAIVSIIIVGSILLIIPGIISYLDYRGVVKAVSSMPWQDGGTITAVREPCVLDTPPTDPVECGISCPQVTSVYGSACVDYIEIVTNSQHGTAFIAAPVGFIYKGGGTHPVANMQFIAGGASNVQPWIIGIPGAVASRIQKLVDWFDFIIAGKKDK